MFPIFNRIRNYLANTSWLVGEKVISVSVGLFTTVVVARYLGPEQYGMLAYAISMMSLFAVAGHMGLSGLVVREIVIKQDERSLILGTTFGLTLFGYCFGYLLLIGTSMISEDSQNTEFWLIVIVGSAMLFQPSGVIDFWFQAHVQSKYAVVARSLSLLISSAVKLALVYLGAQVLLFAFVNLLQSFLAALLLLILYQIKSNLRLISWRYSWEKAAELISQSWIIFLGTLFAMIYLKVDQMMLRWLVGVEEVGIYSIASSLSEAWYFVPQAIVATIFPRLIKIHEESEQSFYYRLQQVFDLLFVLALGLAVLVTLFAEPVISIIFGNEYRLAAPILAIHIWTAVFIFMRAVFSKWILIEGALVFSLVTQGLGAVFNVGLNLYLIPRYAGYGAAIATLISYAVASYFSLCIYKKTRPIFWAMTKSMLVPFRYGLMLFGSTGKSVGKKAKA